jgi:hypothetical protein
MHNNISNHGVPIFEAFEFFKVLKRWILYSIKEQNKTRMQHL